MLINGRTTSIDGYKLQFHAVPDTNMHVKGPKLGDSATWSFPIPILTFLLDRILAS
jgi:hypothetical protein